MNKFAFPLLISFSFFFISCSQEKEISYERFNLVSPGVVRTPDERFKNLSDYDFKSNYLIKPLYSY